MALIVRFQRNNDEEQALERGLGFDVPTRLEMQEIEASSRLYLEGNALVMTATVLVASDTPNPESSPFTFILTPERLVTLRYTEPVAFRMFRNQITQGKECTRSSDKALAALIDAFIDRLADILENVGLQIDALSRAVFLSTPSSGTKGGKAPGQDYQVVLKKLGHITDLLGRGRESLVSFGRLNSFWADAQNTTNGPVEVLHHANTVSTVSRDITSLTDHASVGPRN